MTIADMLECLMSIVAAAPLLAAPTTVPTSPAPGY